MPVFTLVDLDQRPELRPATVALLASCPPGKNHQVCGLPERMGLPPRQEDLGDCLGVLLALSGIRLVGALALCPYSSKQVTLWGPAVSEAANAKAVSSRLVTEARKALRLAGYESMRCLVDTRNRSARSLLQGSGFSAWKDNYLYLRDLADHRNLSMDRVRLATKTDHPAVAQIIAEAFPESDHAQPGLARRERDGFRHYVLSDNGVVVAAAAVDIHNRRSWLKLIAVRRELRRKGLSRKLLEGILVGEAERNASDIGLEVLADNAAAVALYEGSKFVRAWTATIMTGPI